MTRYKRDMRGYGATPPQVCWPNTARIAVQFVLNYEEGGENCTLHGDSNSEAFLSEIIGAQPFPNQRHWNMESMYEYGARAGFWRVHRLFTKTAVPLTVYGVATALARSPEQVAAMQAADWEIASHGLKWIEYKDMPANQERDHITRAIALHTQTTGSPPRGWYTGRCSDNTVDLIAENGGFDYISDSYADDLPYWHAHKNTHQLVIPYTLDANDMRFATAQGFHTAEQFFTYLKDSFDTLYAEGAEGSPKMMSIGLHCRLIGRPGRIAAIARFIDYVKTHDKVWFAKRIEIAEHWQKYHPPEINSESGNTPTRMNKPDFIAAFGGVFEHSDWIAEQAWDLELGVAHNTALGLHNAFARIFRAADKSARLKILCAHPDLAGRLMQAKKLTQHSTDEQAGAGLDSLTETELKTFTQLNSDYMKKFDFPFIIAVKGLNKDQILKQFQNRINNDTATEFKTACTQVERIALLRLQDILR